MARNYKLSILRRLAKYGYPFIEKMEKKKIARFSKMEARHAPIFIVGAPRTGSTILYQMLTQELDLLFIDNLSCIFYRTLFFGAWLSKLVYRQAAHDCFESYHGNTLEEGLHAPSECGDFWYRWLPREKHYIARDELSPAMIDEIRQNLFALINRYDKPLLFKNLNAGQRMGLIHQAAPNARFIFITRNPLFSAQSIWQTKERVGMDANEWWSIMPKNYDELLRLPAHEQIVKQVYYLEKQILEDREYFPPEHFITVTHEELSQNTRQVLDRLHAFIGPGVKKRTSGAAIPELKSNNRQRIADNDFLLLKKQVEALDWG